MVQEQHPVLQGPITAWKRGNAESPWQASGSLEELLVIFSILYTHTNLDPGKKTKDMQHAGTCL